MPLTRLARAGLIRERNWYGDDGMQHCRTIKEPPQAIPTFPETIALLMQPENRHVKFDVRALYYPLSRSLTVTRPDRREAPE